MLWPFRARPAAIPMPDQSISASDAARVLSDRAKQRRGEAEAAYRVRVRAKCREHHQLRGTTTPKILEN